MESMGYNCTRGYLGVKEGDVIEVYSMSDDEEYWYGRNTRTGEVGRFASVTVDKAN